MLNNSRRSINFLSHMGARGCLGQAVLDYSDSGGRFFATTADLARAAGFDRLQKKYPDRLINTGIAEQNLIGVSAGLATQDCPVIAATWSTFAACRDLDQVRNYMGFMRKNVKLVGMDSGLVNSRFGYSHANPNDLAIMASIPGIQILAPCDGIEIYECIIHALSTDEPCYIRLTGGEFLAPVHSEGFEYDISHAEVLLNGKDAAIIATGSIIHEAMKAADELLKKGIETTVINMHSIKPFDYEVLEKISDRKIIISLEEHSKIGGLGSIISTYFAKKRKHPIFFCMGIEDIFSRPSSYEYAIIENELDAGSIVQKMLQLLKEY